MCWPVCQRAASWLPRIAVDRYADNRSRWLHFYHWASSNRCSCILYRLRVEANVWVSRSCKSCRTYSYCMDSAGVAETQRHMFVKTLSLRLPASSLNAYARMVANVYAIWIIVLIRLTHFLSTKSMNMNLHNFFLIIGRNLLFTKNTGIALCRRFVQSSFISDILIMANNSKHDDSLSPE